MACEKLTPADIDQLWENVALWRMYIERAQEEKIFELDKGFHRLLYVQCGCPYWYDLVENLAPHFDRTTILSFRCRPAKTIYEDHVSLLKAIEQKDAAAAHRSAGQHMQRYTENLSAIRAISALVLGDHLFAAAGQDDILAFQNSVCLSADVTAAALLRELDRTCRTVRLLGVYTK